MLKKILLCLLCATLAVGYAQEQRRFIPWLKQRKAANAAEVAKKESDYDKLFKEKHEVHKGMIILHKIKGKLYFEFPVSLLGREMLLGSTVSEISDNGDAIIGSKPTDPLHIRFLKLSNKVHIMGVSQDYITSSKNPDLLKTIDKSNAGAIIRSFEIKAYNSDSTTVVFDVTDYFVSDNKKMTPFDRWSENTYGGMISRSEVFQSGSSFLGEVKSFETNLLIRSHLSYMYSLSYKGRTLAKDVPFTAVMTRSLILLDPKPYRPRITDSRMAIFPTGKVIINDDEQRSRVIYFANRWRLEPSDEEAFRRGELVEPKQPITFYIDTAFPEMWKKHIFEAVEQWNEPFAKVGFKNAIVSKPFPIDDPEFDPDNIKYSCIRYAPIGIQNAMGPSWVDPRSGEILTASVYLYHDAVKLINNWRFIQTAQADPLARTVVQSEEIIGDAMRYVVAHEVGHCLGLMHNMSGSAIVPVDSLRSPTYTQKYGTTTSIMDYARFNYVAQPGDKERGVSMTPPRFGRYDYFTIGWMYKPVFDVKTAEQEYQVTSKWITDSIANPIYRYGKQQFGTIYDPRSQTEDLGDDAIKASRLGISNLRYILSHLNEWTNSDDYDYSYRNDIYTGIVYQYLNYISHVFANVGGIYLNEKLATDTLRAYHSVPRELQRKSLKFICDELKNLNWIDNKEVTCNIPLTVSAKKALQVAMIRIIVSTPFKIDLASQFSKDAYQPQECIKDVYDFVWKPTEEGKTLSDVEMMLQRDYLWAVCRLSGLNYKGNGAASIALINSEIPENSEELSISLPMPKFLKDYANLNRNFCYLSEHGCQHLEHSYNAVGSPVAGYDSPSPMFMVGRVLEADNYAHLLQAQRLIKSKVGSSIGDTRDHYLLLLRNIEKTLK